MAEIKLRLFFTANNSNSRGCAGIAATGDTRRAHYFIHVKEMLLLADSKLRSRGRPIFLVVSCHDLPCRDWVICTTLQKQKNF